MEQAKGTIKTIVTALLALLLIFVLANLVLWNLYKMNIFEHLYTDCDTAGYFLNEDTNIYSGKSGKLLIEVKKPTLLKFDGVAAIKEQPSIVYAGKSGNQPLFEYDITADFKGDFTYTISVYEITSTGGTIKNEKGSFTINPSDLTIIEDNTTDGSAETLLKNYKTRIQKLVDTANESFGTDIIA